jgi:hypothetical protein
MPSGDAQRTWFPEMIVRLRAEWHAGNVDVGAHRSAGRTGRSASTDSGWPKYPDTNHHLQQVGLTGPAADPHVSVRALILALAQFEITSKDQTRVLEKNGQHIASNINWTSKEKSRQGAGKLPPLKMTSLLIIVGTADFVVVAFCLATTAWMARLDYFETLIPSER